MQATIVPRPSRFEIIAELPGHTAVAAMRSSGVSGAERFAL